VGAAISGLTASSIILSLALCLSLSLSLSLHTQAAEESTTETGAAVASRSKRVYVGNLAWSVTSQLLKEFFEQQDQPLAVARADVLQTSNGRSKGCAIVEFATAEVAKKACLTMNDVEFHGRPIFVREDREESAAAATPSAARAAPATGGTGAVVPPTSQSKRVYVGNLSWSVTWQSLKDHMRQAGEVVHAQIISESNTGRSKGCGIVEYATEEEAQKAIDTLTHSELQGRAIFVREDREKVPAAGPPTTSAGIPADAPPPSSSSAGGGRGGRGGGAPRSTPAAAPSPAASTSGSVPGTSVYVWNLSYETTWQELKDHMRQKGNVNSATILNNAQGKSAGCGVVVFQKPSDSARAIRELQDSELNGRPIKLREDQKSGGAGSPAPPSTGGAGRGGGRGGGRTSDGRGGGGRGGGMMETGESSGLQVFVANLSYDTTWQSLKDHFKQCGEVERANTRRGVGTVRFTKKEDAQTAIDTLNGIELEGRALEVRLDLKG